MGNTHRRLLGMTLALALLATGCSSGELDSPFRQNESLEVRISVSNTADETERDGMRLFVDKLVEYSEVPLDISLFYEEDPEASLLAGEADLIYVDSAGLIPYDSDFAIYASPFYFRDYEHMTMTLNSPTFIQLTELDYAETLKARQLGVFYGGTMMVMTRESPIRAVKDMQEFTLAEPSDYYTAAAFESLFGDTTAASATLTETWRDETVTAMEVNSAQLAQLLDEDMEHAYLINTAHRIEVDWLYVSENFYQSAGEELQAAMKEASAYALAYVDADRNKAYEDAYATLQERGLRTARFVTDNLRKSGKELLTSETDFFTQIDKSRYDAVTMIIR